ncbi:Glucose/arabinose dehydrogenase, beta-propeller fold [Halomicrobium zhouii]|uniref:Glucose/arabinose dehydrogenase, beta-propeller fold n=1 Tax=Halomicrobium zhouii TaxID=767519 RepID=A0A1I6LS54_9EURY|nr:PQQ-dependent sugar dehydrogenase [Halomicrobium zhouii]SFS06266.1 Glucose/arabinose dehydrogenase, beta-propeller fold [Halomicrobium zhouii]
MLTNPVTRRRALQSGTLLLGTLAGCSTDQDPQSPTESEPADGGDDPFADLQLRGELLAEGFTSPVAAVVPEPDRVFVADQTGQVHLVDDGDQQPEPFIDVSDRLVELSGVTEQGLLGIVFHPDYPDDDRVFVRYSAPPRSNTPDDFSHTFVLSSFRTDADGGAADPDSETTLLEIPEPQANHNAGAITFGPDGYLYVSVGDGGGGSDQGTGHVEDWYDATAGGNGQDVTENLLGSILRIDVDVDADDNGGGEDRNYAIPDDNPLVGADGLDEHYAWGFRNPWRMSFGPDGRLFAADVGQNAYEEVDVVERGGNYGWNVREGTHCFEADSCPDETPDGDPLVDPIVEYPHDGGGVSGVSVTGGYLYDGDAIPSLQGTYVFADWQADGELFVARERSEGLWPVTAVPVEDVGPFVPTFGRDAAGELLVCTSEEAGVSGSSGAVYRLQSA